MRADLTALKIFFNAFISDLIRAKFRNPDLTVLLPYIYCSKLIITLLSQIATNHTLINRQCHVSSFHKLRITGQHNSDDSLLKLSKDSNNGSNLHQIKQLRQKGITSDRSSWINQIFQTVQFQNLNFPHFFKYMINKNQRRVRTTGKTKHHNKPRIYVIMNINERDDSTITYP